jgi:hypothetical protein
MLRQRLGHVVVGAVDVVVFLGGERGQLGSIEDAFVCLDEGGRRTLVKTLYSQLSTCCWTTMFTG